LIIYVYFRSVAAVDQMTYIADKPSTSIYNMRDYPPQPFTLPECINMHQEAAQPEMTNILHAQIYADCILNFSTRKKVCNASS